MSIFSAFKGIIIVDSHWFRCPRIIVVFVSSSALLSYFTFTAMTSRWPICRRFIIPSKATTRCRRHHRRSSSFDRLNNIIGNDSKVPQPQGAASISAVKIWGAKGWRKGDVSSGLPRCPSPV